MFHNEMAADPFDDLLSLEEDFYKEGLEAGIADSVHAGLIEGKAFGIEKGYEKALELGKAYGRALVWQYRLSNHDIDMSKEEREPNTQQQTLGHEENTGEAGTTTMLANLPSLPDNARLKKHIETLISLADPAAIHKDNSDDSVSELDDRIIKIGSKMKIISKTIDEPLVSSSTAASSIEDSGGLSARH